MPNTLKKIAIGTRKSRLALWQTNFVKELLLRHHPALEVLTIQIDTSGDLSQKLDQPLPEIGGKGLFTAELESALLAKEIDLAVHSLKDLPTKIDNRFVIAAVPKRASAADVLISQNGCAFADLPIGATVGTSSIRRAAQLKRLRPDLNTMSIRGNVETRIRKVKEGDQDYQATVLARAGLERLGLKNEINYTFTFEEMLPAAGQGALAIQCRADDQAMQNLISPLHDPLTFSETGAERSFLAALGGGCNTPVAAFGTAKGDTLKLRARCISSDGIKLVEVTGSCSISDFEKLGIKLADKALALGASRILKAYDR